MAGINCLACGSTFIAVDSYLHPSHGCVRSVGTPHTDVEQPGLVGGLPGRPDPALLASRDQHPSGTAS